MLTIKKGNKISYINKKGKLNAGVIKDYVFAPFWSKYLYKGVTLEDGTYVPMGAIV